MVVSIIKTKPVYPTKSPFNPDKQYPELQKVKIDKTNNVYRAVRESLYLLGLDKKNYGTLRWNPFKSLIFKGDNVVIKPNLVLHYHKSGKNILSVITHASVLRPIIDYAIIALKGTGKITIADAPQSNCIWEEVINFSRVKELVDNLNTNGLNIELIDLRSRIDIERNEFYVKTYYPSERHDKKVIFDLKNKSRLFELKSHNYGGPNYSRRETLNAHNKINNQYCIAKEIMDADIVISVPKLKTHHKAGVTLNLKNMVGINTDKGYLPHWRVGDAVNNGDEFPVEKKKILRLKTGLVRFGIDNVLTVPALVPITGKFVRKYGGSIKGFYKKFLKKDVHGGAWPGNNTLWRTILDINKILVYGKESKKNGLFYVNGKISWTKQRKTFSIIDGIIAGEHNGPFNPDSKEAGVILAGEDFYEIDSVAVRLMGFDSKKISLMQGANGNISIVSNVKEWDNLSYENSLKFIEPDNWNISPSRYSICSKCGTLNSLQKGRCANCNSSELRIMEYQND